MAGEGTKSIAKNSITKKILDILIRTTEFFLVLIILLDCNSVWRHNLGANISHMDVSLAFGCGTAFVLLLLHLLDDKSNFSCVKEHASLFILSALFCIEFNAINSVNVIQSQFSVDGSDDGIVGKEFLLFFLVFMNLCIILFRIYRKKHDTFRLLYLLEHVILFIAVASMILWVGSSVLELWGRNSDVHVFWGGKYYDANYLNLCIRRWSYTHDVTKNLGIFVEPPMFGLMLGYGLCVELFLKKKTNLAIVITFVFALGSCKAIMAILVAMLAFAMFFYEWVRKKSYAKVLIPIAAVCMILGVIVLLLIKSKLGSSFMTHIDDYVASFKCFLEYPIFGCGFDFPNPIFAYISDFRADNLGLSNSAFVVLAEGGIILFAYCALPFILMMISFFRKNKRFAYWAIAMFAFWVTVIFHARFFAFFLMALGFAMVDLRITLFQKKGEEGKKRVECSLWIYDENIDETEGIFQKNFLNLPAGFVMVSGAILFVTAVWGVIHANEFALKNAIACILLIIMEIAIVIYGFVKKGISPQGQTILQGILWIFYMALGQAYQTLNHLFGATGLLIQDCWWLSIVVAVVLFAVGVILNGNSKETA